VHLYLRGSIFNLARAALVAVLSRKTPKEKTKEKRAQNSAHKKTKAEKSGKSGNNSLFGD
jgi:hypothetical protein